MRLKRAAHARTREADEVRGTARSPVATLIAPSANGAQSPRLPDAGGLFGLETSGAVGAVIKRWLFRLALLAATAALVYAVVWLQNKVGLDERGYDRTQQVVQWAELIWLVPTPLAVVLWMGWFMFAEPALPRFVPVPLVPVDGEADPVPARLVFRFVTRGDNVDVLKQSLATVRTAFGMYPRAIGEYALEVVTERPLTLGEDVRVVTVPADYQTPGSSRFKARALTYLQQQSRALPQDWHVYLDEESGVSAYVVAGVYEFVAKAYKRSRTPRVIGQGAILYQGGSWFFRGADALRTADDCGRFRVQYALGVPLFGIHGSYIVTSSLADTELSFDVGYANSITEDAAWGLRAWARGWRFGWVRGCLHEQPPQRAYDFVRQRARWLSGIRVVVRDRVVPLRYRLSLGLFTALWQISFLPFLVAAAGLIFHVVPFGWMRLPADFAWAVFLLAYVLGADTQAKYSTLNSDGTFQHRPRLDRVLDRIAAWLLAVNYIWFALLEAASIVYSLLPNKGFFVIKKPQLSAQRKPGAVEELLPTEPANSRDRRDVRTNPRMRALAQHDAAAAAGHEHGEAERNLAWPARPPATRLDSLAEAPLRTSNASAWHGASPLQPGAPPEP